MISTLQASKNYISKGEDTRYKYRLLNKKVVSRINKRTGIITSLMSDGTWKHKMFMKEGDVRAMVQLMFNGYTYKQAHLINLTKMTAAEKLTVTLLDLTF
jgi:hypothetical protein